MKNTKNNNFSKEEDELLLKTITTSSGNITSKINNSLHLFPGKTYSILHKRWKQLK